MPIETSKKLKTIAKSTSPIFTRSVRELTLFVLIKKRIRHTVAQQALQGIRITKRLMIDKRLTEVSSQKIFFTTKLNLLITYPTRIFKLKFNLMTQLNIEYTMFHSLMFHTMSLKIVLKSSRPQMD